MTDQDTAPKPKRRGAGDSNKSRRKRTGIKQAVAKIGRPTKYEPRFCKAMDDYFAPQELETHLTKAGQPIPRLKAFPTIEGFALSIGVIPDTLHRWATETDAKGNPLKPEFTEAYARARARQRELIQVGGLSGAYNPHMAALAAKNIGDWKEKSENVEKVTHKFADEAELDAIYSQGRAKSAELNSKVGK